MAGKAPTFTPDRIEVEQKGKMVLLYAVTGKEREHMASFFHEHKADYVTAALKEKYGVRVVKKKATATDVTPKATKTTAKSTSKTPVKSKPAKKAPARKKAK